MDLNLSVFQEPRGVMRIFQLVFSICAFAAVVDYSGQINFSANDAKYEYSFDYPFKLMLDKKEIGNSSTCAVIVSFSWDFSSDPKFFVATGVLAMLYALAIIIVYTKYDMQYKSNNQLPLIDFCLSVVLAILWLSSSAAWAHSLSGLKDVTEPDSMTWANSCKANVTASSFSPLNISVVLGFLNFFLWTADLWFIYKETAWFQGNQNTNNLGQV